MKARYDNEAGVILVEPDDPEELIPVAEVEDEPATVTGAVVWTIYGPNGERLKGSRGI